MDILLKPLKTPIHTVIDFNHKTWLDKIYGNLYTSTKCYINFDYDNPIVVEFYNSSPTTTEYGILKQLVNAGIIPQVITSVSDGVLITRAVEQVTKAQCKSWK
jgi:hypothetical protein